GDRPHDRRGHGPRCRLRPDRARQHRAGRTSFARSRRRAAAVRGVSDMTAAQRLPMETPAAIAPLAVLPVFFDLRGRRALVVGGTLAAAWKAELLVAAGAEITVCADGPSPEMIGLLGRLAGKAKLVAAPFAAELTEGMAMAVCDAQDDAEAVAFAAACRDAGIPYNVIDRPRDSPFQFGTIVNRSPVVIGIATAGVAPVLGQAIRRRIEAILPSRLADWAALAGRLRKRVGELLP